MRRIVGILRFLGLVIVAVGLVLYSLFPGYGLTIYILFGAGILILASCYIFQYGLTREEGARRATRSSAEASISVILIVLILIFIQIISVRNNFKIDTTANRRFSLSPQTEKILNEIDGTIMITCFFKDTSEEKKPVDDLLSAYRAASGYIDFRFVNPDRDPMTARRYGVKSFGVLVVESDRGREKLTDFSESSITNAIFRVITRKRTKIYFTTGHGEKDISSGDVEGYSTLSDNLRSENYYPQEVDLSASSGVPADCKVIIIAGPQTDFLLKEKVEVLRFLKAGGSALFLLDPVVEIGTLSEIVDEYGITIGGDVVVDRSGILTTGNYLTPVVNRYGDHPITKGFNYFSFFPQARSVSKADSGTVANDVVIICYTNKTAYAETDIPLMLEGRTRFDRGIDKEGPIPLAAVYSVGAVRDPIPDNIRSETTRVAVFGDSDFASNSVIDLYGNKDLIMNAVNWLAVEEDLISIRPKSDLVQPVLLTKAQGRLVFWLSTIVLPVLVAVAGIVRLSRKRRVSEGRIR